MENLNAMMAVLGNKATLINIANACDKAYAVGTGNPDWYSPYGEEKPEMVARNVAGLQAVVTGIGVIAVLRGITTVEEMDQQVIPILDDIVNDKVNDVEKNILHRLANCSWGAGQGFIGGQLERLTRMNVFDLLDQVEVAKDWHQILAAATCLLDEINKNK